MNVINGLEEDPTAFMTVCSMSAALGATIVLSYSWYLSADRMKKLTASHYSEIENIKSSLRYVNGLDYIFKILHRSPYEEQQLTIAYFHELLKEADIDEKGINKRQIEFLFEMLSKDTNDGMICLKDYDLAG